MAFDRYDPRDTARRTNDSAMASDDRFSEPRARLAGERRRVTRASRDERGFFERAGDEIRPGSATMSERRDARRATAKTACRFDREDDARYRDRGRDYRPHDRRLDWPRLR